MRIIYLLSVITLLGLPNQVFSQNKSLGVGTASPNSNAALHVESPTNNQGFIMPRLTTAQRTAGGFTSVLSSADVGLMAYDTDLKGIFIWNGVKWVGASRLTLPYVDSVFSAPANSNLLRLFYSGSGAENVGVAHFENTNPNNGFSALFARTNSATNGAVDLVVNNTANTNDAIGVISNGVGTAVRGSNTGMGTAAIFTNTQAGNSNPVIEAATSGSGAGLTINQNGTGRGVDVKVNTSSNTSHGIVVDQKGLGSAARFVTSNTSSGIPAMWAETNSNAALSAPVYGLNTGTGDAAGVFRINNASNSFSAMYSETNGSGHAVFGNQLGLGRGGQFLINNSLNVEHAVRGLTIGLGQAGLFTINNASNSNRALEAQTNGTGPALFSSSTGTNHAAYFEVNNNANTLHSMNYGNGNAMYGQTNGTGNAVFGQTTGFGTAGVFIVTNAGNGNPALRAQSNGTGGSALMADHTGSTGNIALFQSASSTQARIDKTGKGFFNGGTQTGGADVAELFDVEGTLSAYEPGDVLVISETNDRRVEKSSSPNSTRIAGVYATKPGVLLTERTSEEGIDDLVPMGVLGVIPTKVCFENGPIKRGDLLVTSSKTGHAMKANSITINGVTIYPTGAILGKALENFESGDTGLIQVLVNVK